MAFHCFPGCRIDRKAECGSESDGSEHSEFVLGKTFGGIADGPEQPTIQIFTAPDKIKDLFLDWVQEESVHREIAPDGIPLGIGVDDALGMAAVQIGAVTPESRHLDFLSLLNDEDDTELSSDRNGSGEKSLDLLRSRVRGDIVIVGCQSEEPVPHASPGEKRLKSLGTQTLHNGSCGGFTHNVIVPVGCGLRQVGKENSRSSVISPEGIGAGHPPERREREV